MGRCKSWGLAFVLVASSTFLASCREGSKLKGPAKKLSSTLGSFVSWGSQDPPMPVFGPMIFGEKSPQPGPRVRGPKAALRPTVQSRHSGLSGAKAASRQPQDRTFAAQVGRYFGEGRGYRVLLETDKPLYRPGERIWMRAVLLKAKGNATPARLLRSVISLYTPRKRRLGQKNVPAYHGHSHTDFRLYSRAPGGTYVLKVRYPSLSLTVQKKIQIDAYQPPRIKKKLRFLRKGYDAGEKVEAKLSLHKATGPKLGNHQVIVVARLGGKVLRKWKVRTHSDGTVTLRFKLPKALKAKEGSLTVQVPTAGIRESISRPLPLRSRSFRVGFFPEGGSALLGYPSRVYFSCLRNKDGKPQDIEGIIQDDKGKFVAKVRSFKHGMGRFLYTPRAGKSYVLRIQKPKGIAKTYALPKAQASGASLQWIDDFDSRRTELSWIVASSKAQRVTLTALQHETLLAQRHFQLKPGLQKLALPLAKQWRGIVRVSLFASQYQKPLAERLVFRHKGKGLKIAIMLAQDRYQPRATVQAKVKVTTPDGKPLKGVRLGVSVVDDRVLSYADDHEPHFLAQRYLSAQLTGKIYRPNFYFGGDESAARGLDLVMGTHGWRGFSWKRVKAGTKPRRLRAWTGNRPRSFDQLKFLRSIRIAPPKAKNEAKRKLRLTLKSKKKKKSRKAKAPTHMKKVHQRILERMAKNGTLGLLGGSKSGVQGILSAKGFGGDDSDALGGWHGSKLGHALGGGGLGLKGGGGGGGGFSGSGLGLSGRGGLGLRGGGGGFSGSSLGLGRIGTYGRGGGSGRAWGSNRYRGRKRSRPRVSAGPPAIYGGLDRNIIRRVIRQNLARFKYCYERELFKTPKLRGKIHVWFQIEANGRVYKSRVSRTTMNNDRVEQCLVRRFRVMRFPAPRGGGIVIANYPLIFTPTGGSYPSSRWRRPRRQAWVSWAFPRTFPVKFYAGNPQKATRKDFRETLFWHPHLRTDSWGEARLSFGLNDSVTAFRIRVSGVGRGQLGSASRLVRSGKAFYISAKIPLEVSEGDAMAIPLTLKNRGKSALTLKVQVKLTRSLKLQEDPLPKSLTLAAGQSRTYFYPIRVRARYGKARVRFVAKGKKISDALSHGLSIRPRGLPRSAQFSARLKGQKQHKSFSIQLPSSLSRLRARIALDLDPQDRAKRALESLIREPYGCFEQTSSSNYPNLMVYKMIKGERGAAFRHMRARLSRMLQRGYKRLTGFETSTGGFSYFGNGVGNPTLTAYGLLQFRVMQKIYGGVNPGMLRRTTRWLLAQRDGKGAYSPGSRRGSLAYARPHTQQAYITYALAQLGQKRLTREYEQQQKNAALSRDPYLLALALMTAVKLKGRSSATVRRLRGWLLARQDKDGSFLGKNSITSSYGSNLRIETTGLSATALLQSRAESAPIHRAIGWLRARRRYNGGYGATQATVLALQALSEYEARFPPKPKGDIELFVNGTRRWQRKLGKGTKAVLAHSLTKYLKKGKNAVELRSSSRGTIPVQVGYHYYTRKPLSTKGAVLRLKTQLQKKRLRMGEVVRLTAVLENTTPKTRAMSVARIAFPGALKLQRWQIKQLTAQKKADFIETHPREITVYLLNLKPREKRTFHFDLLARVTGNYTGAASSAYLYYSSKKFWTSPLRVSVLPPKKP